MSLLMPLTNLKVSRYQIPRHRLIPNTSIQKKPLLIYHKAFDPIQLTTSKIESHIQSVGVCEPQWRYSMYDTTHFHSNTHELLVVCTGRATLCFGGEKNSGRVEKEVEKGDAILIPAGVGHRLLKEGDEGCQMVGCYPAGAEKWDMCYGKEGENSDQSIEKIPWFEKDPLYGNEGPAVQDQ